YNVSLLERILGRAGFKRVYSTMDSLQVERLIAEVNPDIILLDLHMPGMDGIAILNMIRERSGPEDYLPVLMLTADLTTEAKQKGLQAGVNDFLTKPYDRTEVILRITNLLRTRFLHIQLQHYNNQLEEKVRERTKDLEQAQLEILLLLGRAAEYRDDMTGQHTQRVGALSASIAERLGLSEQEIRMIHTAAPLHDIGKIGIPDDILLKPGRFEPHEFERMKSHTAIGFSILDGSSFKLLILAQSIAHAHHEKWDGTGYPRALQGEEIPLAARIVALADFYDALTHERPYKRAWTKEETLAEIAAQRGKHFDPRLVDVFLAFIAEQ
ncbi:MAG: response regulator, partial [Paenibacillaceae bacterium]|nr:response regulator [Paenibacillaceae bacterium]